MATASLWAVPHRWELAAETIVIKIRWFGVLVGYLLVNLAPADNRAILNAILGLGAIYSVLDTLANLRGRVFLGKHPLAISLMEAIFIALLCYFHGGLQSSFRYYYFLSLICCAIRYPAPVTFSTCALHGASWTVLAFASPTHPEGTVLTILTLVMLGWVAWTSNAMAMLLKSVGDDLSKLNGALQENQAQLEARIAERTRQLQEAQAHLLHQEKMAAFGLLAAGIAHEVGNPLTSISSLVQMLQKRDCDSYSSEKLALVSGQLQRIQNILRELVNFSRPTTTEQTRVAIPEIVEEALNIAKYYKGMRRRTIEAKIAPNLPGLHGARDQFVQAILNLVLNAVDATDKGGRIEVGAEQRDGEVIVQVRDDGQGITADNQEKLFQPYFTTKKHGTGLGLFVTRKLIADHGGKVEFASTPGQGTEFRIRLPLSKTFALEGRP